MHALCLAIVLRVLCYWEIIKTLTLPELAIFKLALIGYALYLFWTMQVLKRTARQEGLCWVGPYRWLAHPVYTAYLAIDLASWTRGNITPFFISTSLLLWFVVLVTAWREEKSLIGRFGTVAERYYARTISLHRLRWLWR
jgi:protein-S-isoprenylcysteine O-methyltransferase Ste14